MMRVRFLRGVGLGPHRPAARPGDILEVDDAIALVCLADGRAVRVDDAVRPSDAPERVSMGDEAVKHQAPPRLRKR
jgi:hypothetical protein